MHFTINNGEDVCLIFFSFFSPFFLSSFFIRVLSKNWWEFKKREKKVLFIRNSREHERGKHFFQNCYSFISSAYNDNPGFLGLELGLNLKFWIWNFVGVIELYTDVAHQRILCLDFNLILHSFAVKLKPWDEIIMRELAKGSKATFVF